MATTQIGMLTKKIQRHDRPLVSTPPSTGPIATATPVVAPKTPNAVPRSLPLKALASSARAVANIAAPPMPWKAREMVRKKMSCAEPQAIEPSVKTHGADDEDAPAAVEVRERSRGEQQGGQAERVGVDHPLQVGERRVELGLDVGQRDVHDRDVEQQHEHAGAHGGERPPLRVASCGAGELPGAAAAWVMRKSFVRHGIRQRPNHQLVNDYLLYDTPDREIVKWLTILGGTVGEATDSRELLPGLAVLPGHLFWRAQARVSGALAARCCLPASTSTRTPPCWPSPVASPGRSRRWRRPSASAGRRWSGSRPTCPPRAWSKRVRNPDDRRSYALTRTPEGAAAARRWRRHAEDLEDSITAGFTLRGARGAARLCCCGWPRSISRRTHPSRCARASASWSPASTTGCTASSRWRSSRCASSPRLRHATALQATGPVSQAELARHMGVSGASMVQIVDDLESRGLARAAAARHRPAYPGPAPAARGRPRSWPRPPRIADLHTGRCWVTCRSRAG